MSNAKNVLLAWHFMFSCVGNVSMRYSNKNRHEQVAVLVSRNASAALDESAGNRSTSINTNDMQMAPAMHKVPVSQNQSHYENVGQHRGVGSATANPNAVFPLYDRTGYGSSSASSSPFYQYVPSKVRRLL